MLIKNKFTLISVYNAFFFLYAVCLDQFSKKKRVSCKFNNLGLVQEEEELKVYSEFEESG